MMIELKFSKPTKRLFLCFPARPGFSIKRRKNHSVCQHNLRDTTYHFALIPAYSPRLLFQSAHDDCLSEWWGTGIHTMFRAHFFPWNACVSESSCPEMCSRRVIAETGDIFFSANCCLVCGKSCFSRSIAGSDHRNPTYSRTLLFFLPLPAKLGVNERDPVAWSICSIGKVQRTNLNYRVKVCFDNGKSVHKVFCARGNILFFFFVNDRHLGPIMSMCVAL